MPTYQYEALNETGKPQRGEVTANTSEDAAARIRSQGLFPTSLRERKVKRSRAGRGGKGAGAAKGLAGSGGGQKKKFSEMTITLGGVNTKSLTNFTRQLSTLQDAGLPILRSLSILEQQQKPGLLKNILQNVHEDVSGGMTLSDAMVKHPKAFDKLYTKMIAAGEVGGVLDLIMQRLADFMEKAARLKRQVIGAMIYPAVVLTVAAVIVLGIMVFIVPSFEKIFEDFDTTLPAMTQMLVDGSRWLGGRGYEGQMLPGIVYLLGAPFLVFGVMKLIRKTAIGRRVLDRVVMTTPVLGGLVKKTSIARFTRTLGTLIGAGVPILDAILITRDTSGNHVYRDALDRVHDSVRQGESFAEPLSVAKVCDALVVNMIAVGEETGDLDKMLLKIADNYDEEVDVAVASLVSLLEPFMVVFLGGTVGFIVVALFLPLVTLIQTVV